MDAGKWGYIDRSGRFVIAAQFEEASEFSEGVAAVCCDRGKTRYVDQNGRWAFEAGFARGVLNAGPFIEGIALVELPGGGEAYINLSGLVVAPLRDGG